jgi:hypothetical protein
MKSEKLILKKNAVRKIIHYLITHYQLTQFCNEFKKCSP